MTRYDASSIVVLEGLEAVRRRPAMYIGSTGPEGSHQLVVEVVQNSADEALEGHCTRIDVTVGDDGTVTVSDDGRGIPVDPLKGRPACEVVLTVLHSGGKFAEGVYRASGGLHGVGLAAVNGLSESLTLDVWRDGGHFRQRYERGVPTGALERVLPSDLHGTRISFRPDPAIFGEAPPSSRAPVREHLRALAFLIPGLTTRYTDPQSDEVHTELGGIEGFVRWMVGARPMAHPAPVRVQGVHDGVSVDVALQWTHSWSEDLRAYVNTIPTPQGGVHVDALWAAITRVVQRYAVARKLIEADETLAAFDIREGFAGVLTLRMVEPEFEGQTKTSLTSASAGPAVLKVVGEGLAAAFEADAALAAAVVGKAVEASRARAAARRASERARYQRVDIRPDREIYQQQFGIRSKNWHDSARWLTDGKLLGEHAAHFKLPEDSVLLDVCCGSGVVGNSFRGKVKKIVGLDLTPEMVALSRTRLDEVVQGDVYDIPFPDGSFDAVCNREVLHLLPQPERPVSEVFRVLRPGGQFVVGQWVPFSVVDAAWMFRIVKKKQPLFFNNLMAEDLHALLANAGFVDIAMTEYLQWEDIDLWIDTWETPPIHRQQIRNLYRDAPAEVRAVHPFRISAQGTIEDCWRWVVLSGFKPG